MSADIIVRPSDPYMPVMHVDQAIARRAAMIEFVKRVMVEGVDYGVIPGASKPSLQKPGAEKLSTLFGLSPTFHLELADRDWTGEQHGGEPFFHFHYKCKVWRGDLLIGEGEGSCNSWETKYRYRQGERQCPQCGKAAIIKGKAEYGGGWLCFAKKGGCGAKFKEGDQAIEGQQIGRILNPDPADLVNTVAKMAQKRALVAAILIAVNASEFFTQDIEDFEAPPPAPPDPPATHTDTTALQGRLKALREAEAAYIARPPSFTWRPSAGPGPLEAEIEASRSRIAGYAKTPWDPDIPDADLIAAARERYEQNQAELAEIEAATAEE